jgi:DNA primase
MKRRGLDMATIGRFGLGLAPDAWATFLDAGRKAGFERDTMVASGMVIHNRESDRHYDRFRKRLIFPICDGVGRPIAFGGRVYASDAAKDEPKYVNSPETVLYKKGQHLYALHLAREAIVAGKCALLMEGYMDVIRAHQCGFTNAVASCGTALTEEQARTLKKYAPTVLFVYDGDDAGQKAMLRGSEILLDQDFAVKIVALPPEHDPDTYLREAGAEAFRAQLSSARDAIEFFLEAAAKRHNPATIDGKVQAAEAVLPLLLRVRNPVARGEGLRPPARAGAGRGARAGAARTDAAQGGGGIAAGADDPSRRVRPRLVRASHGAQVVRRVVAGRHRRAARMGCPAHRLHGRGGGGVPAVGGRGRPRPPG